MGKRQIRILSEEQLDWLAFNGFREKLYLMKRKPYSQAIGDESWGEFLSCRYFANAYLKPGASTGMHHHDQVCIVSVVTSGTLTHEDSEGNTIEISAGQCLVQVTGPKGFKHNESNYSGKHTGMLQLWFDIESWTEVDSNKIEQVTEGQQSRLIGKHSDALNPDIMFANYYQFSGTLSVSSRLSLLFCYSGSLALTLANSLATKTLRQGQMAIVEDLGKVTALEEVGFLMIGNRIQG